MAIRSGQNSQQNFKTRQMDTASFHQNMSFVAPTTHPRTPTHSKNPSAIITFNREPETRSSHSVRPPTPHTSHHAYSPTLVPISPVEDHNFTKTLLSKLTELKRELDTKGHTERICITRLEVSTPETPDSRDDRARPSWWDVLGIENVRGSTREIPDIWKIHERERVMGKRSASS